METEITLKKTKKDKIYDAILYFFIYAFLGWVLETIYAFFIHGHFVKRGFLYGPICPIYGFGAIILILATKKMYKKPFLKFVIATASFTIFEYFVSFILEILFDIKLWDYSNDFLNIQGRVSILYSIAWGVIGVLLLEKLHPFVQDKVQILTGKIARNIEPILVIALVSIVLTDTVFSSIKYLNM